MPILWGRVYVRERASEEVLLKIIVQNYKRELNPSYDRELDSYQVIQDIGDGPILTFIKCLSCGTEDLLYFEDDALLCKGFKKELKKVFDELGTEHLIQLFSLKRLTEQTTLMAGSTYCANVCFFIPSKMRQELVKYFNDIWSTSKCYKDNPNAMDFLVRDYLKHSKNKYYLYIPNLVQHLDGKSVIDSRRSSKRQSKYFIDREE